MKSTTVEALKSRLDAGEEIVLLDVREDDERSAFNIGGIHQKLGLIQSFQIEELEPFKNEEIIVYCRSGRRSQMAGMLLEMAGFSNLVNLEGGMLAWEDKFGLLP